jgi:hypothetical protein
MKLLCRIIAFIFFLGVTAVAAPEPIIDAHFHTFTGGAFSERMDDGKVRRLGTITKEEALAEGLEVVRKHDIYAITGGPPEQVDEWVAADPERFIPPYRSAGPIPTRLFLT